MALSMYGRGDITSEKLKNIELPAKIKCKGCNKIRNQSSYSEKQLNDARWMIIRGQLKPTTTNLGTILKCRTCTGQQHAEMTCFVCDTVKSLDEFSKAQRKTPDRARCNVCVIVHESTEADYDVPERSESRRALNDDEGSGIHSNNEIVDENDDLTSYFESSLSISNNTHQDHDDGVSIADSTASSHVAHHNQENTRSSSRASAKSSSKDDVTSEAGSSLAGMYDQIEGAWVTAPSRRTRKPPQPPVKYRAYDRHGVAHSRTLSISTTSTSGYGKGVDHYDAVDDWKASDSWNSAESIPTQSTTMLPVQLTAAIPAATKQHVNKFGTIKGTNRKTPAVAHPAATAKWTTQKSRGSAAEDSRSYCEEDDDDNDDEHETSW